MLAKEPIFVTGAAGFVGRHLVNALQEQRPGVRVAAPDIDVRDAAAIEAAIADVAPGTCVHLAAISSVTQAERDHEDAWQVNLHGTLNIARAILAKAPQCRLLYVSSADAYGASFLRGVPLDETAPLAPMSLYGATKAAADLALGSMATQGLRVVRMRPFNHVGTGQSASFVVASFARQIMRIKTGQQEPVIDVGRVDTRRDFLDVRDVCAAYIACIYTAVEPAPGAIFNVASGTPRRIGDVLDHMLSLADIHVEIRGAADRIRNTDILTASGDARRLAAQFGWAPRIPWEATLQAVLDDWRRRMEQ